LDQNLLARVYLWTILVAFACGLVGWFAVSSVFGAGIFLTAVWAVAGFRALEGLLRSAVLPPGVPRNIFAIILWILAKLAIYGMAVWVLFSRPFPPVSHAVGFTLMLVVLVALGARARSEEIRQSGPKGKEF
jgi:hypothetical protein